MLSAAYLHELRLHMRRHGVQKSLLISITGIDETRMSELLSRKFEPFLDEAYLIARALGLNSIIPLISGSGNLTEHHLGIPMPTDVDLLRAGARLPLQAACRIAAKLRLDDPIHLVRSALTVELWSIMSTLRSETCPFCKVPTVGEPAPKHADDCLPDILWGHRTGAEASTTLRPARPGVGRRASGKAQGLKRERIRAGQLAQDVARAAGLRADYFSKLERERLNLTTDVAERIAAVLGCDVAAIYAP